MTAQEKVRATRDAWKASMTDFEQTTYGQCSGSSKNDQLGRRMIKQIVKRRLEAEPKLRLVQGGKRA